MLRACIAGLAAVLLAAGPASAQTGINLSWDDCGTFGTAAKMFACDANGDSSILVGSFSVPYPQASCIVGVTSILDLQVSGSSVPDWWMFKNAGSCRQTSLRASGDFWGGPQSCFDWNGGCGLVWMAYDVGQGGANRARITVMIAMPCTWCLPAPVSAEIYAFRLILRHDRTVGTGVCAGCQEGVCIVLNSVRPVNAGGDLGEISVPLERNYVTWQDGTPACPAAVPVRAKTWGAVKALYR